MNYESTTVIMFRIVQPDTFVHVVCGIYIAYRISVKREKKTNITSGDKGRGWA